VLSLHFLGATGTVTGSKYFIRTAKHRGTMVDCGLFQGPKDLRAKNWDEFPLQISDVHNIVLTHAHLDHTGYLPRFAKQGFRGRIFANPSTQEVTEFILRDSAKLQEEDAEDANKHQRSKHQPALPLYTKEDAEAALGLIHVVGRNKTTVLPDDLSFRYFNAGHILGSNFVLFEKRFDQGVAPVKILFSGDLGRKNPIYLQPKESPPAADYVICESTYGDRLHPDVLPIDEFGAVVEEIVETSKVLVIPAFAVDRAQEIIYVLNGLMRAGRIPAIPVFIDSPMATGVTALYEKYSEEHTMSREELMDPNDNPLDFPSLNFVRTPDESKRLNQLSGPAIIISASGMATGGRILHHLKNRLPHVNSVVLFTGYQSEATLGRQLLEGATSVSIHGDRVQVKASVRQLTSFSGHADQNELIEWLSSMPAQPKRVFLTHGEDQAREALAIRIRESLGWDVAIPHMGEIVDLLG
jgi:metallo-beta-lactamase family protein